MPQGEAIGAPRVPGFALARPRLTELLEAPSPLRLVRAPAGSGKTALLTMWVRGRRSRASTVWVALEDASRPSVFVWGQLADQLTGAGVGSPAALAAAASEPDVHERRRLLLRGFAPREQGVVLVLDDADHADDALAADLLWLVERLDDLELVVASRQPTPFESVDAMARLAPTVLGAEELRMTPDEVAALARDAGLPDDTAALVMDATDGVPYLARAVTLGLRGATMSLDRAELRIEQLTDAATDELLRAEYGRGAPAANISTRGYAEWLLENGHPFRSFRVAVEAGELSHASRVARGHMLSLLGTHGREILALLTPVSRVTLRRYPLLALMLALIHNARGHRLRALEYLVLTAVGARAARVRAEPQDRAVLLGVESTALRVAGRTTAALRVAQTFSATIDDMPPGDLDELTNVAPVLFAHVGVSYLAGGDGARALDAFERASSFAPIGDEHELHPLALRAGTHALRGEIDATRGLVERIRARTWPEASINGYRGAFVHLAEAMLALEELDFARARDGLEIVRPHLATLEHWPLFAHVIALADLGLGQPARSDLTLKRELRDRRRASITSLTGAMLSATRATLLLADGKATEAAELLASAPMTTQIRVAQARVALLSGEPEQVIATIAGVEIDALAPRPFAELQLLHAAAARQLGHADAARTALGAAMAALTEYGMRHPLALVRGSDRLALAEFATPGERALLLDDRIPELLPRDVARVALTQRERVVLERLALGGTLPEIAAELHVSVNTLKTQLRAVYRKLGVSNREAALVAAARHGLLRR